jgi:hypothetical protein
MSFFVYFKEEFGSNILAIQLDLLSVELQLFELLV